jgi:PAS domain S-box-containing protein
MKELSRLELETIVKGIPAAVLVIEKATGTVSYVNDYATSLLGYNINGLRVPSETDKVLRFLSLTGEAYAVNQLPARQALATGKETSNEFVVERPNGSRVVVRGLAKPVKDEHGNVIAAVTIMEDITERKLWEESLRDSEERFRLVAEAAKVLVYEIDLSKNRINILQGEEVLGYGQGEIPKKQEWWLSQLHPNDMEEIRQKFDEATREGKDYFLEYRIKCKQGNYIIAHDSGKPIRDNKGKFTKFIGGMRDVTERKTAEEALKRSRADLMRAQSVARIGSWRVMAHTNELFWSDETYNIFGIEKSTPMTYERFLSSVYPDDRDFVNKSWQTALTGERYDIEHRICVNDNVKWVRETAELEFDVDKLVSGFGTVQDITERRIAEEELGESEERFSKAFNANPAAISISRMEDGLLVNVNETYLHLFEFSRSEVIGKTSNELGIFTEAYARKKLIERISEKGVARNIEMPFLTKTGKRIDTLVSLDKINIHDVDYMISTVTDITDRKRDEQALLQSQELLKQKAAEVEKYATSMEELAKDRLRQLKESERLAAIGATAGMVGHDIRNPLQAIVSDVYLLKESLRAMPECETKVQVDESLDGIDKNISYINKIVADLQDYARSLNPEYTFVDLADIVKQTLKAIDVPDNIQVANKTTSIELRTDAQFIRRALTNLTNNAIQAMPNGGNLTIEACERDGKSILTVEDTGAGIPDNIKPKLFTPMMTTKSKGQGLGLAVVKRLVEALDGTITFESQEGKGTKFIIELPKRA